MGFGFLERSAQRTEVIEVPRATEVAAVAPVAIPSDQSAAALPDSVAALPPAPAREDYDNRCLPIFFTWRRKTTSTIDSGNNQACGSVRLFVLLAILELLF